MKRLKLENGILCPTSNRDPKGRVVTFISRKMKGKTDLGGAHFQGGYEAQWKGDSVLFCPRYEGPYLVWCGRVGLTGCLEPAEARTRLVDVIEKAPSGAIYVYHGMRNNRVMLGVHIRTEGRVEMGTEPPFWIRPPAPPPPPVDYRKMLEAMVRGGNHPKLPVGTALKHRAHHLKELVALGQLDEARLLWQQSTPEDKLQMTRASHQGPLLDPDVQAWL